MNKGSVCLKTFMTATTLSLLLVASAAASVKSYSNDTSGITCTLDKGFLKIIICKEDIIEVRYTSLAALPSKTSLVVNNKWEITPQFSVSESSNEIILTTRRVKVKVDKGANSVRFTDVTSALILAEDDSVGKKMTAATVVGINTYNCGTLFQSPADEALYGLGCHPEDAGAMNYKGRNQDLAIKYMTGAVPVLLSTKGYGLLWDNYSASNFYGAEAKNTKYKYVSESGTMVDYYFFYGPDFDHIIALYRDATGQAPMFPKWGFGLIQSQDRYQYQTEVLSVKDNYRNNNIPVDCIVQDWFYWEPNVIGSHVMDPGRYPNPKAMVDSLHKANIHAMISIWPVFAAGTANFTELQNAGGLTDIKWQNVMTGTYDNYYDAHSSSARHMYWRQAKNNLIVPYGWDAWWVDQCEPDNGILLDARRQSNFALGKGIDYFNTYSLAHTIGLYNNWRADILGKRAFFLVRQSFAGQQRNASILWSSDIESSFKLYKIQVPQGINTCASGIPYWTSDIGGYRSSSWTAPNWSTASNRELFTRWFQFGTFCPIFRIHGKGERALFSKNWDANTKSILLNYDNLRYRLLPYIYSLAWKVTSEGYTMMRALAFDFRTDAAIYNIQDQYMFGPAFLVNPVTAQAITRKVYLPKSTIWYNFWTGEILAGGHTIDAQSPIETIPLYVRAGSIVPMGPFMQYATEKSSDTLELRIYPGADGQFTLYEDENDTYNYENGQHSIIPFIYYDTSRQLIVGARQGTFPLMSRERVFNIVWVDTGNGIGINSPAKFDTVIHYNGTVMTITSVSNITSVPNQAKLEQNYPNPFNASTKISYSIMQRSHVTLKIYDLLGREVAVIVDQLKDPGFYTIDWNAKNFLSGVYLYQLQAGDFVKAKTLLLLK
ncbi:MAG: TIM-barrel domain-containing protein [Bacteroidota bacterium]